MTIESLRTPDDRFVGLPDWPYAPRYIDDLPGYQGLRMHYIDEGPKKEGPTFLCLHGEPTWSYLYRKMLPVFLAAGHRIVAVDLFGFGRSDKPIDDTVYTFSFHRNALLAFVQRLDLRDVCLVVQDWGGILGLTLPMEAPARYTRLIVMNTVLPAGEEAGEGFAAWRTYNRSQPDLDVAALMKRTTPILSDAEAAAYAAPFPDARFKGGVRRFPELVMLREAGQAELTSSSREGVQVALRARDFWSGVWAGASFMAVGMRDPVLGPSIMQDLRRVISKCPDAIEVAEGGHFVQEWGGPIAKAALERFRLD